jgi:hypothetical protein
MRALIVLGVLVGIPLAFGLALHDSPPITETYSDPKTAPVPSTEPHQLTQSTTTDRASPQEPQGRPAAPSAPKVDARPNVVIGCQSLDRYKRFADFDYWSSAPVPQELTDGFRSAECKLFSDVPEAAQPTAVHVEKTHLGYTCLRVANAPEEQCYWITTSELLFIGHGPQLSDEQFAQVLKLRAEINALIKEDEKRHKRLDELDYEGDGDNMKLRVLNAAQKREEQELIDLGEKTAKQEVELLKQEWGIVPLGVPREPWPGPGTGR